MSINEPFKVSNYSGLSPDAVLDAVESVGFLSDGTSFALNSYENRVYQIGIEESSPLIAKFYRPLRWSDAQIIEEHSFSAELTAAELPVVSPINIDGTSLFNYQGYRFALYPRQGGREPNLDNPDNLIQLGRCLGRIHAIAASKPFQHRPDINILNYGYDCVNFISEHFIPKDLATSYSSLCTDLLAAVDHQLKQYQHVAKIRSHGDCHVGNILWRDDSPHFVDFDDCRTAPAVQDLWLLLNGERHEQEMQLAELITGYEEFYTFAAVELNLIESLRTLRLIHYSAWLARRWQDPAFPKAFPWFNSARYWGEHILELREQMAAINEPALRLL